MAWICRTWWICRVLAVVLAGVAAAIWLSGVGALAQTVETPLHEMADAAGVIFVGQVLQVRHVDGAGIASGVVEVQFRVDRAVLGCAAGGTYVLREWAGLWTGGEERYRVGQRLLMLLHTPSAAGMSSPVGGLDGAIPIRGVESELAGASASVGGRAARPVVIADLRWVGTRMVRPVSYVAGASRGPLVSGLQSQAQPIGAVVATAPVATSAASASVASPGASVDAVVGMLSSWEGARATR